MPVDPELDGPAYEAIHPSGPNGRPPAILLPAQEAVDALIAAEGNSHLAAERLGVTTQVLVASIAQDSTAQSSLNAQLRTLTTLQAFDTLRSAKAISDQMIADLDPADFVKFYAAMVKEVASLTDDHTSTQNINVTEVVLRMLPPEARSAMLALIGGGGDGSPGSAQSDEAA